MTASRCSVVVRMSDDGSRRPDELHDATLVAALAIVIDERVLAVCRNAENSAGVSVGEFKVHPDVGGVVVDGHDLEYVLGPILVSIHERILELVLVDTSYLAQKHGRFRIPWRGLCCRRGMNE